MKESVIKAVVSTLITSALLLLINVLGGVLTESAGQVISSVKSQQGSYYEQTVFIQTWKELKENIVLSIYGQAEIIPSAQVKIVETTNSLNKKTYEIYDIPTNFNANILIRYIGKEGFVKIENIIENKLLLGFNKKSLIERIIESTVPIILLYFIFTLVLQFINYRYLEKAKEISKKAYDDLEKIKKESEIYKQEEKEEIKRRDEEMKAKKLEFEKEITSIKDKMKSINRQQSRYRIIQSYKMNDMATELDFWYNLIKQIFIKIYGKDETMSKEIIAEIRETLKTKKNYTKINDPKSIEFYEKLLNENIK